MDDATQKLVDEARGWAQALRLSIHIPHEGADLLDRLADALEAAQRPPATGDATQKIAQEAWDAREATLFHDAPDEAKAFIAADRAGFLAGFEAEAAIRAEALAQRPPASPEVRDEMRGDLSHHLSKVIGWARLHPERDFDPQWQKALDEATDAILARFSFPSQPPVSPEVLAKWGYEMSSPHVAEVIPWAEAYEPLRDWWLTQARKIISASVPSQPVYDEEAIARWLFGLRYHSMHWLDAKEPERDEYRRDAAALVAALRGGELTREEEKP